MPGYRTEKKSRIAFWFYPILLLISLAGAILIGVACPRGVGIGYDSYKYLTTAESLVAGQGLQFHFSGQYKPLTHFPPLYPLLWASLLYLGAEALQSATLFSQILGGAIIFTAGFLVYQFSRQAAPALAAAFITCVSPIMIDVSLEAMSEPLFFIGLLASLGFLAAFVNRRRWIWFIAGAGAVSLASLSRYIGISLVVTGAIVLFLQRGVGFRRKMVETLLFLLLCLLPISSWLLRNYLLTGSLTNRLPFYHPINPTNLAHGLETIKSWFLPGGIQIGVISNILIFMAALSCIYAIWLWLRNRKHPRGVLPLPLSYTRANSLIIAILVFSFTYVLFLVASLTWFDAAIKINNRILSPLYLVGLLIPFLCVPKLDQAQKFVAVGLYLVLLGLYYPQSRLIIQQMQIMGRGFNSQEWEQSETVAYVRSIPADVILYSNEVQPLEFLTGRTVKPVPEIVDSVTGERILNINQTATAFHKSLQQPGHILVIITINNYRPELLPLKKLTNGLELLKELQDGQIFVDPQFADQTISP